MACEGSFKICRSLSKRAIIGYFAKKYKSRSKDMDRLSWWWIGKRSLATHPRASLGFRPVGQLDDDKKMDHGEMKVRIRTTANIKMSKYGWALFIEEFRAYTIVWPTPECPIMTFGLPKDHVVKNWINALNRC